KLVSMCDISVSASRREGLPVNLIEAMAIGKPIIATNVRGNADLVENGKNGYIVELDNWQEMADRICELYTHPETAEKMSKSAVKMAEKYSIENVNHTLSEVYKKYGALFNC
ncbi:MAG: glycosyltransferase, partial [Clostridia bacterium]|nr:glycosyltransferase [Clostridia bacterium]